MRNSTRLFIVAFISMVVIGCTGDQDDALTIHIKNESSVTIYTIRIYTVSGAFPIDSLTMNGIGATDSIRETWKDMKLGSTDGTFLIVANFSGKTIQKRVGYYTNGILLDSDLRIVVYADSLVTSTTLKRL